MKIETKLAQEFDALAELLVGFSSTYPVPAVYDYWLESRRMVLAEEYGDEAAGQLEALVAFCGEVENEGFIETAYPRIALAVLAYRETDEYREVQRTKFVREFCRDLRGRYVNGKVCNFEAVRERFGGTIADWHHVASISGAPWVQEVERLAGLYSPK